MPIQWTVTERATSNDCEVKMIVGVKFMDTIWQCIVPWIWRFFRILWFFSFDRDFQPALVIFWLFMTVQRQHRRGQLHFFSSSHLSKQIHWFLADTEYSAFMNLVSADSLNKNVLQGRSQGWPKPPPVSSKKKGKNNLVYSHCTLNCTQSFMGGEMPWVSYDATKPLIWHPSIDAVIDRFATTAARRLNFLIWTYTHTSVHCTIQ